MKIKLNPFSTLRILFDILISILSYYLSYFVRHGSILTVHSEYFTEYLDLFLYVFVIQIVSYSLTGMYRHRRPFFSLDELKYTFNGVFLAFILTTFLIFASKGYLYSRAVVILWFVFIFILISFNHFFISRLESNYYIKGKYLKNVAIVGTNKAAHEIRRKLEKYPTHGMRFIGFIYTGKRTRKSSKSILGNLKEMTTIIRKNNISEIIIADQKLDEMVKFGIVKSGFKNNIKVLIVSNIFELMMGNLSITEIYGIPTITLAKSPIHGVNIFIKRLMDITLSFLILLLGFPIFLLIALAILIDSKGSVFFKQIRVTKHGKIFRCMKFRSMVANAEDLKENLSHLDEKPDDPIFKIKNDPRITKVGKILRKYSLDELPQFINVLRGDMSLVGPRPPIPKEVEEYTQKQLERLKVKQGISGLWQVSGRSELSFQEMVNLDIFYIEHWTLWLDIKIILKTIPAILTTKGAY
ncbi:sugar transferase [bacterium]|nr:sugar transferase [bacterium]